jgi:hypothetical protein
MNAMGTLSFGRRKLAIAIVTLAALWFVPSALAGQIVYLHGGDLWAMSDGGGAPYQLATAAQIGGAIGPVPGYNGVSVQPNGTAIAFNASVPAPNSAGNCTGNCPGMYTLINGVATRLSAAPFWCGGGDPNIGCESADLDPAITGNGQLIYLSQSATNDYTCGSGCGNIAQTTSTIDSRPLAGGTPAAFPGPSSGSSVGGEYPSGPILNGVIASDPADPTKIAYTGSGYFNQSACAGNCYPIDVQDSSGAYNQPYASNTYGYSGLAFSQSGSLIAGIESPNPGIWVYPSTQNYSNDSTPTATWALGWPSADKETITGLTFVANSDLVFSWQNNLWELPASCWSKPITNFNSFSSDCGLDNAKQLTTDGTSAAPDTSPAWTSSDATIEPLGGNVPAFKVTLTASAGQKVLKQKGVVATVKCNVICAFAAIGGIEIKGSKKELNSKQASGQLAANGSKKVTLKLSSGQLKTIEKALKKHKKVTAVIVADAKDLAGKTVQVHSSFTVKH